MGTLKLAAALLLTLALGDAVDRPDERLYGQVTTSDGDVLEGFIRWDRNEAGWSDFLDGQKELPWEYFAEAERLDPDYASRRARERSIEAFGVRITWDIDDDEPNRVSSAIRFGHLESLVPLDNRSARLWLKSGESIDLRSSSSDLGRNMRRMVLEELDGSETELRWSELDRVDFMAAPDDAPPPLDERLHGTVLSRGGDELVGWIAWDLDEVFMGDVLDGRDVETRRDMEIEFRDIAAIERDSRRSARVVLRDGTEHVLRGTNDVDRDNRGIEVTDATFGRATVGWEDFESLTLHDPEVEAAGYDHFTAPGVLTGTVVTEDGETVTGVIRWDNDESAGWEVLDGVSDGVEYDIEFGHVLSIEKADDYGVNVVLRDGRALYLEGSNDVDRQNKGVFITPTGGRTELVRWDDFARIDFTR